MSQWTSLGFLVTQKISSEYLYHSGYIYIFCLINPNLIEGKFDPTQIELTWTVGISSLDNTVKSAPPNISGRLATSCTHTKKLSRRICNGHNLWLGNRAPINEERRIKDQINDPRRQHKYLSTDLDVFPWRESHETAIAHWNWTTTNLKRPCATIVVSQIVPLLDPSYCADDDTA